jgi:hypothetical protein
VAVCDRLLRVLECVARQTDDRARRQQLTRHFYRHVILTKMNTSSDRKRNVNAIVDDKRDGVSVSEPPSTTPLERIESQIS